MYQSRKVETLVALGAALMACAAYSPAHAELAISNAATANVSCASNICTATHKSAILNVTDLETMLASASVVVVSGATAKDIVVAAPLSWASARTLTLDSYHSLTVEKPVSVNGAGDLAIATNDGGTVGTFLFTAKGHIAFLSTTNSLTIDGTSYTLVSDIASLASDVAANPSGNFALANSYNAKADGTCGHSPIPTAFSGSFTGLGNAIFNLKIDDSTDTSDSVGFFSSLGTGGLIADVALQNVTIEVGGKLDMVGSIAGASGGSISGVTTSGTVSGTFVGGVAGSSSGSVMYSQSSAAISVEYLQGLGGGLIGESSGTVAQCFATGEVTTPAQAKGSGGLIGSYPGGTISDSYATGKVFTGGAQSGYNLPLGGLIGNSVSFKIKSHLDQR